MTTPSVPRFCECGCGEPVARRFKPGHDARLKSQLVAATRSPFWQQREAAVLALIERGWGNFIDLEILGTTPKRGRSSTGRRVESLNVQGLAAWHVDQTEVGHSHRFCPEIQGSTHMTDPTGAWGCGTCTHLTELIDDVMALQFQRWVWAEGEVA